MNLPIYFNFCLTNSRASGELLSEAGASREPLERHRKRLAEVRSVLQSIKALFGQGLPCSSLPLGLFAVPALEQILDSPELFWGLLFDFWHPPCSTPEQSCTKLCLNNECNALMLADCAHSFIPEQAHFRLLWPSASRFVSWSLRGWLRCTITKGWIPLILRGFFASKGFGGGITV